MADRGRIRGSTRGVVGAAASVLLALLLMLAGVAPSGAAIAPAAATGDAIRGAAGDIGPGESPRPVVLLFHPGGFFFGDPSYMAQADEIATAVGFEAVGVTYPLGNLPAAVNAAERLARKHSRRGQEVYAYGESAGGTLAALLAQRGLVEAAATYSQITNVPHFVNRFPDPAIIKHELNANNAQLRRSSPGLHSSANHVLALTPTFDWPYLNRDTHRWDRRSGQVAAREVTGEHIGDPTDASVYPSNVTLALTWLWKRAASERP